MHRPRSATTLSARPMAWRERGLRLSPWRWWKQASSAAALVLGGTALSRCSSVAVRLKSPRRSGSGCGTPCCRMHLAYRSEAMWGSLLGGAAAMDASARPPPRAPASRSSRAPFVIVTRVVQTRLPAGSVQACSARRAPPSAASSACSSSRARRCAASLSTSPQSSASCASSSATSRLARRDLRLDQLELARRRRAGFGFGFGLRRPCAACGSALGAASRALARAGAYSAQPPS